MTDEKYKYLFPFEKIPQGSRILIYGAGLMGIEYFKQLDATKYCSVLGFIDREWKEYKGSNPVVYSIQECCDMEFDYIVMAIRISSRANVITKDLTSLGIPLEKIIYTSPRMVSDVNLKKIAGNDFKAQRLAFEKSDLPILIRLGNGLGSAVIKKKIFEEMSRVLPNSSVDVYAMIKTEDLTAIYGCEQNFNVAVHESGEVYERNKHKYVLAMRISTSIAIDHVDYDVIEKFNAQASALIKDIENYSKTDAGSDGKFPSHIHVTRNLYKGKNCYTAYDCGGLFQIRDMKVRLALNPEWKSKYNDLKLKKYITINYGSGMTMGQEKLINKQWPYANFCKLVSKLKKRIPNIDIIQIGSKGARQIECVDRMIVGENLELVKYVLANSLIHIDIEGGLVHLASQLGSKCVVLFGPTPIEFFGYPQNINISAGTCHGCIGLYENGYACARGLEKPECMYSITPEMVMEKIAEYIDSNN